MSATKKLKEAKPIRYLTVKKVVETEECYTVSDCVHSHGWLAMHLRSGALNIVQSATVEPMLWIVDEAGHKIATLEKDGGTHSQKTDIKVG